MRHRYQLLYRMHLTPWVGQQVPAALRALLTGPTAPAPALAVDLGCGTGEHARFLASLGWSTTAIDFVPTAIATARRRDHGSRVTWRVADVTRPEQVDPDATLTGAVRLLLDIGCLHGLSHTQRTGWAATVNTLAATTAATLLIRAAPAGRRGIGPAGIDAHHITALLAGSWRLTDRYDTWYRYGRTAG